MSDIINTSYMVGVAGRNLVLQTLGKVYVKVKDRYYELPFDSNTIGSDEDPSSDIYVTNTKEEAMMIEYPGDNKLIISLDGGLFITSEGKIIEWEFKVPPQDLDVNNLTIHGVLTIETPEGFAPLIINSRELVRNLNAQYLNGYGGDSYAIKSKSESILGQWSFMENVRFYKNITVGESISNEFGTTELDLKNSVLNIDYINVRKGINIVGGDRLVDGLNLKLWLSNTLVALGIILLDRGVSNYIKPIQQIQNDYENGFLDTTISLNNWFFAFLSNYYLGAENDPMYIEDIRNLDSAAEVVIANSYLSGQNILDFISLYYTMYRNLGYDGEQYQIAWGDDFIRSTVSVNTILSTIGDELCQIVNVKEGESVIVQFKNNDVLLNERDELIVLGHPIDPKQKGNIVVNSLNRDLLQYVDILSDTSYTFVDGQKSKLSNNNNIIARIGRLDTLADDSFFKALSGMGVYLNGRTTDKLTTPNPSKRDIIDHAISNPSGVFIKNSNICLGDISVLNPDGSGMLSDGRMLWTGEELSIKDSEVNESTIINSTIDQVTFSNSALQAGGDLKGVYPNPEITRLQEILDRLDIIESKLSI